MPMSASCRAQGWQNSCLVLRLNSMQTRRQQATGPCNFPTHRFDWLADNTETPDFGCVMMVRTQITLSCRDCQVILSLEITRWDRIRMRVAFEVAASLKSSSLLTSKMSWAVARPKFDRASSASTRLTMTLCRLIDAASEMLDRQTDFHAAPA